MSAHPWNRRGPDGRMVRTLPEVDPERVMAEVALRRDWGAVEQAIGWREGTSLRNVMRRYHPLASQFCHEQIHPPLCREEILAAVEKAGSINAAAKLLGTTRDRLYSFCRKDPEFYEKVRRPIGSQPTFVDKDAFVVAVRETGSIAAASESLGVGRPFYWMNKDPEFAHRVRMACSETTIKTYLIDWPSEPELLRMCLGRGVDAVARSLGTGRDPVWSRLSPTSREKYLAKRPTHMLVKQLGRPGSWVSALKRDPCCYCGRRDVGGLSQIDHIEPRDGTVRDTDPMNKTAACLPCNVRKRNRPLLTFLLDGGRRASSLISNRESV